jgi:hypothetical protein
VAIIGNWQLWKFSRQIGKQVESKPTEPWTDKQVLLVKVAALILVIAFLRYAFPA